MKSLIAALCLVTASLVAGSASAAQLWYVHGASCVAAPGSQVTVGQYGINASTSAAATVVCPLALPNWNSSLPFTFAMTAYDRHPTENVVCYLHNMYSTGQVFSTAMVQSAYWASGANGYSTTGTTAGYPYLTCTIPGATANGASHLTTLYVSY